MEFVANIEVITLENEYYRHVVNTTRQQQLVLMSLKEGEEIGMEIHPTTTQFIRIEWGEGYAILNGRRYPLYEGICVVVPPGTSHNVVSLTGLKLYTIYSPPEHPEGLIEEEKP